MPSSRRVTSPAESTDFTEGRSHRHQMVRADWIKTTGIESAGPVLVDTAAHATASISANRIEDQNGLVHGGLVKTNRSGPALDRA